jgi:hypothetical protein
MSRAAFAREADGSKSSSARMGGAVCVSKPGDSHEVEADRVADTVMRGGQVPGWSLAAKGFDGIQRKPAESHADPVAQVEQALVASAEGRAAIAKVTAGAASALTVTGATAAGVVAALATGRKGTGGASTALDGIHPGLSVKVTREGGAGGAEVALNYAPKTEAKHAAPEKKAGPKLVEKPEVKAPPHDDRAVTAPKHGGARDGGKKEELTVHRKAERAEAMYTGSAEVDSVLRSPGREMEPATRREMESRIGFDFGRVRLHTDARAGESAQGLSARAYTVGSDVVFAPGKYAPQTTEGRHLLAHELTHVVQQTSGAERGRAAGLNVAKPAARTVQRAWSGRDLPGVGWLLDKIHDLQGYDLFSFVIGKDLIEDKDVDRNATNLIGAVLQLLGPFGRVLFEKLKKVGNALEGAYQWLIAKVRELGLTEKYFSDLLSRAWDAVSGWHPIRSWERIVDIFGEPLDKIKELARAIIDKVEEFILEAAFSVFGETGRKVYAFFKKAGSVIARIATHPLQFGENLLKAVGEGFKNFFAHIWDNLKEGVKDWVYQELDLPSDIKKPEDFTLGSMFKLLLQVLGLTWEHRRPQLVEKLQPLGGETVVFFFEKVADKGADVIKRVKENGFSAIKEMIAEQASDIFNGFVSDLKSWIATELIERGLKLIAELSNPAGEIIKIVESIINTVTFIIEKAKRLGELINTVVDALSEIVEGNTEPAAKKVEGALKKSIPLLLGFIADQFGLKGIGKSIREIIHKIRKPIDDVIGKVLDVVVKHILPVWEAGKAAFTAGLEKVKNWWTKSKPFRLGTEPHEVSVEGDGAHPDVFVHSADKTPLKQFLKDVKASKDQTTKIVRLADKLGWKQGELQTPAADEAGSKTYDDLAFALDHLKAREASPSRLVKPQTIHPKLGTGMDADWFITANRGVGSDPVRGQDPVGWADLGYLLGKKFYVRGHLLSNRLGGQGVWENMMPLTNAVNGRMNAKVEAHLKKATANTDRAYHYIIKADYEDVALPEPDSKLSAYMNKKLRADAAESRLKRISWTVQMAKPDANGQLVDDKEAKELIDGDGKAMPSGVAADGFDPKDT